MIDYTILTDEEFFAVRAALEEKSENLRQEKVAIKQEVLRREATASVGILLSKLTAEEKSALQVLAQGVGLESAASEAEVPTTM